jgi:signal transduction histidine kinase
VTSTKISGKTVRVQITDYGAGIPKEFRENVFQKFMRAPQGLERKMEGTGLGLFICKEIIEAMGGAIGFDSTPNKSTTFWFSFPVVD